MHYYGQTGKLSADREIRVRNRSQDMVGRYLIRLLPDILRIHQYDGLEISY